MIAQAEADRRPLRRQAEIVLLPPRPENHEIREPWSYGDVLYEALMRTSREQFTTNPEKWQKATYDFKMQTLAGTPLLLVGVSFRETDTHLPYSDQVEDAWQELYERKATVIRRGSTEAFQFLNPDKSVYTLNLNKEPDKKRKPALLPYTDILKAFGHHIDTNLGLTGKETIR